VVQKSEPGHRDEAKRIEKTLKKADRPRWKNAVASCVSIDELEQLNTYRLSPADIRALKPYAATVVSLLKKSVASVVQAGEALIEAKNIAGHGHWGLWIEDNCGLSWASVNRYMKLAEANAENPELLKDITSLKEAYIAYGIIKRKAETPAEPVTPPAPVLPVRQSVPASPLPANVRPPPVHNAATAPEPVEPAEPPIAASSIEVDLTAEAQRNSGSGNTQTKVSYLEKAFAHDRLTLAEAVEFLVSHKEQIEDVQLLKPLADYYAKKTQAVEINSEVLLPPHFRLPSVHADCGVQDAIAA